MAKRRMMSLDIIDTDMFLDMPSSTQNLYFHYLGRADDDGFIDNPKKIMTLVKASDDDLKLLILKQFVIPFETGVCVIKHWRIHNYIQRDRYKETLYLNEKSQLIQEKNGMYTRCIQNVSKLDTQDRLELGKVNNSTITIIEGEEPREEESQKVFYVEEPHNDNSEELNLISYLEKAFGRTISAFEIELISDWKNDEITRYAIKESVKNNARSIKYIERIVQELRLKGITTEADAVANSDEFRKRKNKKGCKKSETTKPNWFGKDIPPEELTHEERSEIEKALSQFK